ncbi:MAG TPA: sensor histidine kinase [Actinocatenispora sp.]
MYTTWLGRPEDGPPTWDVRVRRVMSAVLLAGMSAAVAATEVRHWSPPRSVAVLALLGVCAVAMFGAGLLGRHAPRYVPWVLVPTAVLCAVLGILSPQGVGFLFLFMPVGLASNRWPLRESALLTAGTAALYWFGYRLAWGDWPEWYLLAALAGSYLGGRLDRAYHERVRQSAELLAQTQRARDAEARSAALAERTRLAREIHDVLAHSLAALAVQLEAADALLAGGRADDARDVVQTSRRLAREGLAETKQAVLALREGGTVPLPEALAGLVRIAGPTATLRVTGTATDLGHETGFALYRIAQEALTNAGKHAPGAPVDVELSRTPAEVTLVVTNGPGTGGQALSDTGSGYGLVGMRERLEPLGGTLTAGPDGAGWRVTAKISV